MIFPIKLLICVILLFSWTTIIEFFVKRIEYWFYFKVKNNSNLREISWFPFIYSYTREFEYENYIYSNDKYKFRKIVNHEKIHCHQQLEFILYSVICLIFGVNIITCLIISLGQPIIYFSQWIIKRLFTRSWYEAYKSICFEIEAYDNQGNSLYRKNRTLIFSWILNIFKIYKNK